MTALKSLSEFFEWVGATILILISLIGLFIVGAIVIVVGLPAFAGWTAGRICWKRLTARGVE